MEAGSPVPNVSADMSNVSTVSRFTPENFAGRLTDVHGTLPEVEPLALVDWYRGSHASRPAWTVATRYAATRSASLVPLGTSGKTMFGAESVTTRTIDPVRRASTRLPLIVYDARTRGWPARSTRMNFGPYWGTVGLAGPASLADVEMTSTWSPLTSRFSWPYWTPEEERSRVPVTCRVAASMTSRVLPLTVTIRRPSVFTRSGSSTPAV